MAVPAAKAFGSYLRILRKRAGLSLQEVEDLARGTPSQISKNYLSRCENGQLGLALGKMTILCRIYDVPPDVVLERMELDLELEQIGGPDTEKMDYEEMIEVGKAAAKVGDYWPGYACFRDAVLCLEKTPTSPSFKDQLEQHVIVKMNCATAMMRLCKSRLALHEFQVIADIESLSAEKQCLLYNRLSNAFRYTGELIDARIFSNKAVELSKHLGYLNFHPYYLADSAAIALEDQDLEQAKILAKTAQSFSKNNADPTAELGSLRVLGSVYMAQKRFSASKKTFFFALKLAKKLSSHKMIAVIYLYLGKLETLKDKQQQARDYWQLAKRHARKTKNNILLFQVDLCLLEQAIQQRVGAQERNAKRRLARQLPFLPQSIEEVHIYKRLIYNSR